jgi:hypothetical protein
VLSPYARLLPWLQLAARHHGYNLLVHGSGVRDLDLVAVPWVRTAAPTLVLVQVLLSLTGGQCANVSRRMRGIWCPHHRRAWIILLPGEYVESVPGQWTPCYLDLSVMPVEQPDTP